MLARIGKTIIVVLALFGCMSLWAFGNDRLLREAAKDLLPEMIRLALE